jgi:hypothetical protein
MIEPACTSSRNNKRKNKKQGFYFLFFRSMASRRGQTQEPMSEEKIMDVISTLMRDVRIENNEKIERNQKEMEEVFIRNREENRAGFEKLQSMIESVINRLDHQQESLQQAHLKISVRSLQSPRRMGSVSIIRWWFSLIQGHRGEILFLKLLCRRWN